MIFFCNLQPTRCAKIQTSWAWNCCSIILTKSVWKVMTTMGHDVHGIESAVCHEISSLLLDETSQVLSVSYLRTNLSMLLHTICLKEKKSKVTILLKLRHDCHEKIWGLVIDSWQKTKPTAFSEIDTFFHRNITQFRM